MSNLEDFNVIVNVLGLRITHRENGIPVVACGRITELYVRLKERPGQVSQEHASNMPSVQLHVQGQRGLSSQNRMCMR
ncbi:MAG: hypothetical protein DRJ56_07430 [Thermoprotei archaeon]|nr:MAG: hypothetical protein DRJ56_07430 [Thermoprotei archaeon]